MGFAQNLINSIEKIKFPSKKMKVKDKKEEKEYIEKVCLEMKKKNPNISSFELSNQLGITKEVIEKIFEKDLERQKEEEKKKSELLKKPKEKKQNKFFIKLKNIFDEEDKKTSKELIAKIILYGLPLNFALFVIFSIKFNWYSWVAWGIVFWFIEKPIVDIIRAIWIK